MSQPTVDVIGDIHGHADELESLLKKLGYRERHGVYHHPQNYKVLFLGDFIDRGPKIGRTLEVARRMVDAGHAWAIMGNHELNALAYHTSDQWSEPPAQQQMQQQPDTTCPYLRQHSSKNTHQHQATLDQLSPGELEHHLAWFRRLPLWLDLPEWDGLRAIHACWDDRVIDRMKNALSRYDSLTDELLHQLCHPEGELFNDVEILLKGKEADLPEGFSFVDKDGNTRNRFRTRWYKSPVGQSYRSYAFASDAADCDADLSPEIHAQASPYPLDAKPVFFGHYWLKADRPVLLSLNVACLDYSVAKHGFLCAYRWQCEKKLTESHFVW